jgi:hypothetical protein
MLLGNPVQYRWIVEVCGSVGALDRRPGRAPVVGKIEVGLLGREHREDALVPGAEQPHVHRHQSRLYV